MAGNSETFKRYSADFILNILATFLSTGTMQLVVLPQLARHLSTQDYGILLTATGFMNILINAFGNNLCNSRLRQQIKYTHSKLVGDYPLFLIAATILAILAVFGFNNFLKADLLTILLPFAAITVTGIWKAYYLAAYRIEIN